MSDEAPRTAWIEDETGKRIELTRHFTVGRAPASSLVLKDPDQCVSAYHAQIERDSSGRYFLEDRHSTNGTFANGQKVTRHALREGDRLRFGSPRAFVFHGPALSATASPREKTRLDATARHYEERDCWFLIGDIKGSSRLAHSLYGIALARLVNDCAARCRDLAQQHGGALTTRTGDGWLLLWSDAESVAEAVAATLRGLREMQRRADPPFRVVIHRGRATIAGSVRAGEDNVLSAELHQAFRMEKIAARLDLDIVASEAAATGLRGSLTCRELPGAFELAGFEGRVRLFVIEE